MKQGWEVKKFEDVFDLQMGKTPSRDKSSYWNEDNVWVSIADLNDKKYISESKEGISNDAVKESGIKLVPKNTVIMSFKLSIGKTAITTTPLFTNEAIMAFIVKDKKLLISEYIYYYLKGYKWVGANKAVLGMTLNKKSISGQIFSYPPLPEQEKIVAELDCLSGIIEKKKQQLKELDALAQSIFYEMFGDPEDSLFPLQRLSSLSTSKLSYGSGASAIDYNGEVRYIRITDIMEDGNLSTNAMSPSVYDEKYRLYEGDILFARSGATVGKTYLYKESDGVAIYAGYLIRFVPNHELVIPEYIYYFTRSSYYQAFIKKSAQAVAQPNINAKQYGDLQVSVPPLSLQHTFASKVEAIEKQKELIKQSIAETELLFNSRMQYYFG